MSGINWTVLDLEQRLQGRERDEAMTDTQKALAALSRIERAHAAVMSDDATHEDGARWQSIVGEAVPVLVAALRAIVEETGWGNYDEWGWFCMEAEVTDNAIRALAQLEDGAQPEPQEGVDGES